MAVISNKLQKLQKQRRKARVRSRISGTAERPRVTVYRSSFNISAQVIDDVTGRTLASASSFEKTMKKTLDGSMEGCAAVGKLLAERCKAKQINAVVFDKNGNIYHGRVKALAEAMRANGLAF